MTQAETGRLYQTARQAMIPSNKLLYICSKPQKKGPSQGGCNCNSGDQ